MGDHKKTNPEANQADKIQQWGQFVEQVSEGGNQALVSLLNNAVVLEVNPQRIRLGTTNLQIFTHEKKEVVLKAAQDYFSPAVQILYEYVESMEEGSLRSMQLAAQKIEEETRYKAAEEDRLVKEILRIFPGTQVQKVTTQKEE